MAPKLVFAAGAIERRDYRSWLQGLPNAVAVVGLDDAMPARADSFERFIARGAAVGRAALEARRARVDATDPCLMVYTSGSTGAPKGLLLRPAALVGPRRVQLREWHATTTRGVETKRSVAG